jgi:uncharacterized membrane protein YfcA
VAFLPGELYVEYLIIGLAAGVLSGMFGIGGGVVIVPALVIVAKFAPDKSTGTSLAALLLPVGALGAWQYYRQGLVDLRVATLIALGLLAGAFFGAHIALRLPAKELQRSFAVFLVFVAGYLWMTAR